MEAFDSERWNDWGATREQRRDRSIRDPLPGVGEAIVGNFSYILSTICQLSAQSSNTHTRKLDRMCEERLKSYQQWLHHHAFGARSPVRLWGVSTITPVRRGWGDFRVSKAWTRSGPFKAFTQVVGVLKAYLKPGADLA